MSTLAIDIDADWAASVRAGLDPTNTVLLVDLEYLTTEQRELLAQCPPQPIRTQQPTVDSLLDAIQAHLEHQEAVTAEIRAAFTEVLQARRTYSYSDRIGTAGPSYDVLAPDWPDSGRTQMPVEWRDLYRTHMVADIVSSKDARRWKKDLKEVNAQARSAAMAQQEAETLAERRNQTRRLERLRVWALNHGSERLQLLIDDDYDWADVAREEYFETQTPAGFVPHHDGALVRPVQSAPTLQAIKDLHAARIAFEDSPELTPQLVELLDFKHGTAVVVGEAIHLVLTAPDDQIRDVWQQVTSGPVELDDGQDLPPRAPRTLPELNDSIVRADVLRSEIGDQWIEDPGTWRYVVSRELIDGDLSYSIRELFIGEDGTFGYTAYPHQPWGKTSKELRQELRHMRQVLKFPILDLTVTPPILRPPE